ncbi:MAG TPA: hypothetical protein VFC60_00490 [Tissierellaceae bacterium]|nr:hypothetical protein [Tissierellaceae bacterium]
MYKKEKSKSSKFKVLLVAYKDLSEEMEKELLYYFVSNVRKKRDIEDVISGSDKSSSGLSYRTSLYHRWFRDIMEEKLDEGYNLGMVEIARSYGDSDAKKLKELDDKFGDDILIIATEEL